MNEKEVMEKIIELFSEITEKEEVTQDSELIEDLELTSIEVFTLLADLEAIFDIVIPEKMIRRMGTINDVKDVVMELMEARGK